MRRREFIAALGVVIFFLWMGDRAHPVRQPPTTGSEIAKPALARHLDGDGKDQMRRAGRPLHQRIGCAGLEEICHALGAR